jgi:hypothetical protein
VGNSKTRGKGTALQSGTAASQAESRCSAIHERQGASRRLFIQGFHAGLSYVAPPVDAAAGGASGQDGVGGLVGCRSCGGVYGNKGICSEVKTCELTVESQRRAPSAVVRKSPAFKQRSVEHPGMDDFSLQREALAILLRV